MSAVLILSLGVLLFAAVPVQAENPSVSPDAVRDVLFKASLASAIEKNPRLVVMLESHLSAPSAGTPSALSVEKWDDVFKNLRAAGAGLSVPSRAPSLIQPDATTSIGGPAQTLSWLGVASIAVGGDPKLDDQQLDARLRTVILQNPRAFQKTIDQIAGRITSQDRAYGAVFDQLKKLDRTLVSPKDDLSDFTQAMPNFISGVASELLGLSKEQVPLLKTFDDLAKTLGQAEARRAQEFLQTRLVSAGAQLETALDKVRPQPNTRFYDGPTQASLHGIQTSLLAASQIASLINPKAAEQFDVVVGHTMQAASAVAAMAAGTIATGGVLTVASAVVGIVSSFSKKGGGAGDAAFQRQVLANQREILRTLHIILREVVALQRQVQSIQEALNEMQERDATRHAAVVERLKKIEESLAQLSVDTNAGFVRVISSVPEREYFVQVDRLSRLDAARRISAHDVAQPLGMELQRATATILNLGINDARRDPIIPARRFEPSSLGYFTQEPNLGTRVGLMPDLVRWANAQLQDMDTIDMRIAQSTREQTGSDVFLVSPRQRLDDKRLSNLAHPTYWSLATRMYLDLQLRVPDLSPKPDTGLSSLCRTGQDLGEAVVDLRAAVSTLQEIYIWGALAMKHALDEAIIEWSIDERDRDVKRGQHFGLFNGPTELTRILAAVDAAGPDEQFLEGEAKKLNLVEARPRVSYHVTGNARANCPTELTQPCEFHFNASGQSIAHPQLGRVLKAERLDIPPAAWYLEGCLQRVESWHWTAEAAQKLGVKAVKS